MVLAVECGMISYSRRDTFQGNWKNMSMIDRENQLFKTTRRALEKQQNISYCSERKYQMEF